MESSDRVAFKLAVFVTKRGKWHLAVCPALDLAAQGPTPEKAVASLRDAVRGFVADCFERGVLDEVLKRAGFGPSKSGTREMARRSRKGKRFVSVPFYLTRREQQSLREA
jgi:predicted RNase H-like HicB family nuclease